MLKKTHGKTTVTYLFLIQIFLIKQYGWSDTDLLWRTFFNMKTKGGVAMKQLDACPEKHTEILCACPFFFLLSPVSCSLMPRSQKQQTTTRNGKAYKHMNVLKKKPGDEGKLIRPMVLFWPHTIRMLFLMASKIWRGN